MCNPACPRCGCTLGKVTYPRDSMLNEEQFDAVRAGDWYCTVCPSNGRGNTSYRYFFDNELTAVSAPPEQT